MDTQAAARIGLDELDQIIDRLYGRLIDPARTLTA